MVTPERFAQGLTVPEYLEQMTSNKARLLAALEEVTLGPEDGRVLERYGPASKILVITEDWCGTALASLPFVMKLAEATPGLDVRVFLRDENPDLMDRYLKEGRYRSIPVYVLFDERMKELARFIEQKPA